MKNWKVLDKKMPGWGFPCSAKIYSKKENYFLK
jgi:hypothetical protein